MTNSFQLKNMNNEIRIGGNETGLKIHIKIIA